MRRKMKQLKTKKFIKEYKLPLAMVLGTGIAALLIFISNTLHNNKFFEINNNKIYGIKWGSKFSNREDVENLGTISADQKIYIIKDFSFIVKGIKINRIFFITYKDQLSCVVFNYKSKSNFKKLLDVLFELTHTLLMKGGSTFKHDQVIVYWMSDILYSDISYNIVTKEGRIFFGYIPLFKQSLSELRSFKPIYCQEN